MKKLFILFVFFAGQLSAQNSNLSIVSGATSGGTWSPLLSSATTQTTYTFTPNADNFNDYFQIKHIENYPNSKLVILNRWGDKVFESLNYQNEWAGKDCSEGTYYYILNLKNN